MPSTHDTNVEQVRLLYAHQPYAQAASVLNGAIMVAVCWQVVPHGPLVAWYVSLICLTLARLALSYAYRRAGNPVDSSDSWGKAFTAGVFGVGVTWGVSAVFLPQVHSLTYQLLFPFMAGGMVAGAAGAYSVRRDSYYAFALPAFVPQIVGLALLPEPPPEAMVIPCCFYLLLISFTAESVHAAVKRALQLRLENQELIGWLESSQRQVERVNEELQEEVETRLRAEASLLRLNEHLESEVRKRTMELEQTNRELAAFTRSVSHDLRSPLRTIEGFSHLLWERSAQVLDEAGAGYVARIREGAQQMEELVDDLLRLSRASQQELRRTESDLSQIVRELEAAWRTRVPCRQVEFAIEEGLVALCDEALIRIALENLVANAWKFTRKIPVARIAFGLRETDRGLAYFLSDNGAGFDPRSAGKLFQPFERLHSQSEFEGTGVGLATVLRVMERHGGSIWADAEIGRGATFYFTLDRAPREVTASTGSNSPRARL